MGRTATPASTPVGTPKLRHVPGWNRLVAAVATSVTGDQLSTVAVAAYLLERGSSAWVAAYFFTAVSIRIVVARYAGTLADRTDRKRILVATDLLRGALFVGIAVMLWNHAAPLAVLGAIAVSNALGALYRPAFAAWMTHLVPADLLPAANSVEAGAHQLAWTAGPALGAIVAHQFSPGAAVVLNAASFVVAGMLTALIHEPAVASAPGEDDLADVGASGPGLSELGKRWFWVIVGATMTMFGAELVLVVTVADQRLHLGGEGAGYLTAALGAGGLAGALVAPRAYRRLGALPALALSGALSAAMFAVLGAGPLAVVLVAMAIKGAVDMLAEVAMVSSPAALVPGRPVGRGVRADGHAGRRRPARRHGGRPGPGLADLTVRGRAGLRRRAGSDRRAGAGLRPPAGRLPTPGSGHLTTKEVNHEGLPYPPLNTNPPTPHHPRRR